MNYKELIANKRVIFVGPAPNLIGKKRADFINSFDVVCRSNGSILLLNKPEFKKDYGNKIDVLYSNVQFHREMGSPFPLKRWKDKHHLKFLCMKTCGQKFIDEYKEIMPVRTLNKLIGKLHSKIEGLLMGPIILTDILAHHPKELYFTGMNFFIDKPDKFIPGDYREYYPNYLPEKIRKKANVANIGRIDPHDQLSNARYVYGLYKNGLLKTDKEIVKIMEKILNNPEYYTYKAKLKRVKK